MCGGNAVFAVTPEMTDRARAGRAARRPRPPRCLRSYKIGRSPSEDNSDKLTDKKDQPNSIPVSGLFPISISVGSLQPFQRHPGKQADRQFRLSPETAIRALIDLNKACARTHAPNYLQDLGNLTLLRLIREIVKSEQSRCLIYAPTLQETIRQERRPERRDRRGVPRNVLETKRRGAGCFS
ncbi:hypothetical protein EVAR_18705_1 [Eumeta japonica]|uniref:Uncharacterized protein n=1 Tax=Eumeta variegata TaxID=151549 RepID=A0A4C1U6Q0_EUMVA|nr:hypothetical protein EVAR_18705_1 [Eumeta japonica]